jgi:hypothetical protein
MAAMRNLIAAVLQRAGLSNRQDRRVAEGQRLGILGTRAERCPQLTRAPGPAARQDGAAHGLQVHRSPVSPAWLSRMPTCASSFNWRCGPTVASVPTRRFERDGNSWSARRILEHEAAGIAVLDRAPARELQWIGPAIRTGRIASGVCRLSRIPPRLSSAELCRLRVLKTRQGMDRLDDRTA